MNSCYDGFCGDYRVTLKLNSSFELTVEAEQRRTHQIYRETFENEKCAALTQSMYLTNTELYAYLKYLMTHGCEMKDEQCSEKLTAQLSDVNLQLKFTSDKILDTTTTIHRGFQLELVKIQLEDISRLENIINDLCRRVEDLESRVVPREQCTRLRGLKFEKPTNAQAFTFTGNDRTCINSSGNGQRIVRVNRPFANNQERYQKIDFKWNSPPVVNNQERSQIIDYQRNSPQVVSDPTYYGINSYPNYSPISSGYSPMLIHPSLYNQAHYQQIDVKCNSNIKSSYVGVRKTLSTNEMDIATNEDDRWFFSTHSGHLYSKEKNDVAYLEGAARVVSCTGVRNPIPTPTPTSRSRSRSHLLIIFRSRSWNRS